MSDAAHAVVFADAGRLDFRAVTLREPAADEVVVATRFSSISAGTERLLFEGKLPPIPMVRYPLVPGYEAVGTVTAVGVDVHDVRPGDDVFVGGSMCFTDVAAAFGGQASHLVKKASLVVSLHGIPLAHAPLLALAATSLHGVRRMGDLRGKRVAVVGMGAIGQFAARFIATQSPAALYEVDRAASRLGHVPGAISVDATAQTLAQAVSGGATAGHHGHGHGAAASTLLDCIIEATGNSAMIGECAKALAPGGSIGLLSYYDTLTTPFVDLFVKEATLVVAREWEHPDLLAARDAIADGSVAVADLAGSAFPITQYEAAYAAAFGDPLTLKVILDWN